MNEETLIRKPANTTLQPTAKSYAFAHRLSYDVRFTEHSMLKAFIIAVIALQTASVIADELQVGSPAELWLQRSSAEKLVYLEGICEGLQASNQHKLGELPCDTFRPGGKYRFCLSVNSNDGEDAIAYMDRFYQNNNQTDIPTWAAIAAFNDKACNENIVTSSLAKIQKRNECYRQSINMLGKKGISEEAKKAQDAHCKELNF